MWVKIFKISKNDGFIEYFLRKGIYFFLNISSIKSGLVEVFFLGLIGMRR